MSNVIEPIVISSGEENEVVILREVPGKMDMSRYNSKLKALKSRKQRNRLHSTTKSAPKLQMDKKKWKKLKAVVKLEQSPIKTKLTKCLKKEEQSDDEMLPDGMLSPSKKKAMKPLYPSPCKKPSTQANLFNYLNSPPKFKTVEDAFTSMTLSPSKTPSPATTPQKAQSTLENYVTPSKRVQKQIPHSPSCDVNAKRNELVWPPPHVVLNTEAFIKKLYEDPRDFPTTYKFLVESLQDEKLLFSVVKTIDSCMSKDFAPSADMIWYLVKNILSRSSDTRLISLTYSLLNRIIERYPKQCIGMNITSEDVQKYFFQDLKDGSDKKSSKKTKHCSKLASSFLLSVIAVELKETALKSKQIRLSKHFSTDFNIHHVKYVMPQLKKCLENHTATPSPCGTGDRHNMPEEAGICGLELFQNILKLIMVVSLNKENVAIKLADQLMYLYIDLPNLQQRVLLLQSVTSHYVRQHLTRVLLMNYCSLLSEARLHGHDLPLCVRKILLQDFYRQPPSRDGGFGHSAEDVEEYITLLAYLLQSYVVIHTAGLGGYHNDYTLCVHDNASEFSQEDVAYLKNLKGYVSTLRMRCVSFLHNGHSLSLRTNLLLNMMEVVV